MKKKRIALIAALVCVLVLGTAAVVWATGTEPTVVFDASAKTFTFQNCTAYTYGDEDGDGVAEQYPDLFPNIKNAMPGDRFSQTIRVKVINAGSNTVKLYLRAENPNADYDTLFNTGDKNSATLTAAFGNVGGAKTDLLTLAKDFIRGRRDTTVTTGDTDTAYLGAYGGATNDREIDVTFSLPLEAGNEYADLTAMVDWVFLAEIIPESTPVPPVPGDDDRGTWNLQLRKEHCNYVIGRTDGKIYPEAPITRAEVTTILFRLLTDDCRAQYWRTSNPYGDVALTDWYNNAISTMTNAGVIEGFPDGLFRPNQPVTRAEFVTMISRILTAKQTVKNKFSDVSGHWAQAYIDNAVSLGILNGYPDGTFRPEQSITRAEVMALCNRLLGRFPEEDSLLDGMIRWPDNLDTEKWYYLDVQEATNSHLYELGGRKRPYLDYEYWTQLTELIRWEALERPDAAASNLYRSNRPAQ